MSDTNKDQPKGQNIDSIIAEAQRLLAEIGQFRTQAEEQFKAAELSRKNADSEGLFALNAKKVCEKHATAISQIKGNVESEVNTIRSNKQTSDELLAALTAGKATMDADTKTIGERRKEGT
jgi:ABC-type transporter Mla subunit MlaD